MDFVEMECLFYNFFGMFLTKLLSCYTKACRRGLG